MEKKGIGKEIEKIEEKCGELSASIKFKQETRSIECSLKPDWQAGTMTYFRNDTGEVARVRMLDGSDRQQELSLEEEEDGAGEGKPFTLTATASPGDDPFCACGHKKSDHVGMGCVKCDDNGDRCEGFSVPVPPAPAAADNSPINIEASNLAKLANAKCDIIRIDLDGKRVGLWDATISDWDWQGFATKAAAERNFNALVKTGAIEIDRLNRVADGWEVVRLSIPYSPDGKDEKYQFKITPNWKNLCACGTPAEAMAKIREIIGQPKTLLDLSQSELLRIEALAQPSTSPA